MNKNIFDFSLAFGYRNCTTGIDHILLTYLLYATYK
jgi:hypothetical protein